MTPYRILVVDDSAFMRKFVSDIVGGDEAFAVIGTARTGREAIEAVKRLHPDAVTMDLEMPEMTGLEALPFIMKDAPTPVVMLSSSTHEGAEAAIRSLELGAFDFVAKPSGRGSVDLTTMKEALLSTLHAAVSGKREEMVERLQPAPVPTPLPISPPPVIPPRPSETTANRKPRSAFPPPASPPAPASPLSAATPLTPPPPNPVKKPSAAKPAIVPPLGAPKDAIGGTAAKGDLAKTASARDALGKSLPPIRKSSTVPLSRLVAIGTSTGGPRALQQVLTRLPEHFPAPVLVVQHMPPGFTKSLAQRLDMLSAIRVVEAEEGMEASPGTAYIAPGGLHMTLKKENGKYRIRLSDEPLRNGHRPSVDVLFESLVALPELDRTAVIMTGMGSDGAKGMKLLHDNGVKRTIAEHSSSCIVYGMPRAAVELGCVSATVPLDSIAKEIMREVNQAEEV